MEKIFEKIKKFILTSVNHYIEEETTKDVPLTKINAGDIIFGQVDLLKYKNNILVAIVPIKQENGDSELADYEENSNFVVSFIARFSQSEILIKQMCRYAFCFKKAIYNDGSLGNTVDDVTINTAKFYSNAGTVENQMSAVEIDISVTTSVDYD